MGERKLEELTLDELWCMYREKSVPADIPPDGQWVVDEVSKAWHCGAAGLLVLAQKMLKDGVPAKRQAAIWDGLRAELDVYDLKRMQAPPGPRN